MKKIGLGFLEIIVLLFFNSCWEWEHLPVQKEYNQRWKNSSKMDIIKQFGAPRRIVSLDGDGSILVYENYRYYSNYEGSSAGYSVPTNLGVFSSSGSSGSSATTEGRSYVEFYIDKQDNCYMVRTNYTKAVKAPRPGKTVLLIAIIASPFLTGLLLRK